LYTGLSKDLYKTRFQIFGEVTQIYSNFVFRHIYDLSIKIFIVKQIKEVYSCNCEMCFRCRTDVFTKNT